MKSEVPHRAVHSYTQRLEASPDAVFPLLCPVRECEWVEGWNPRLVVSGSGLAELDCVFVTGPAEGEATWVVTEYEPPVRIGFVKVMPGETVVRISIELAPEGKARTRARVTYGCTALSEEGRTVVDGFTEEHYAEFMNEWEEALNRFLARAGRGSAR
jgi:hypothetical protein